MSNVFKRVLIALFLIATAPISFLFMTWFCFIDLLIVGGCYWIRTGKDLTEFKYLEDLGLLGVWFRVLEKLLSI